MFISSFGAAPLSQISYMPSRVGAKWPISFSSLWTKLLGFSKLNPRRKMMKQQGCAALLCASEQPRRRSLRSQPTASASFPFIYIFSNFLSSVLVLITIIALQWVLTSTAKEGNMGRGGAATGLKSEGLLLWDTAWNESGNHQVCSREPQASRWFIHQLFWGGHHWVSGWACLWYHPAWCTQYRIRVQICLLEKVKACGLWHTPGETVTQAFY